MWHPEKKHPFMKGATKADLESDIEAHKDAKLSATKELMATLEYIAAVHVDLHQVQSRQTSIAC